MEEDEVMDEEENEREEDEDDGISKEQWGVIQLFQAMEHKGTRFPDDATIRELGFRRDMDGLFENTGLTKLMRLNVEGYKEETCFFLATLKAHSYVEESRRSPDGSHGYISFWCRDQRHVLTTNQLDTLFDFPASSDKVTDVRKQELHRLWKAIASGDYSSSSSKSAKIRNPTLRYFHKCIANTIFARKATGNLNESELGMLAIALSKTPFKLSDGRKLRGDRNSAGVTPTLIAQLMTYKTWALKIAKKANKCELRIGGLITPILLACEVDVDMRASNTAKPEAIDLAYLKNACFLARQRHEGRHVYLFDHHHRGATGMLLPNPGYTSILGGYNVEFHIPTELLIGEEAASDDDAQRRPNEEPAPSTGGDRVADEFRRFHFEEYTNTRMAKPVEFAHKHISILQKWNKMQDKVISRMKKQMKAFQDKLSCSSSGGGRPDFVDTRGDRPHPPQSQPEPRRNQAPRTHESNHPEDQPFHSPPYYPHHRLEYSGFYYPPPPHSSEFTPEPAAVPEQARASSYEPREQKKQKRSREDRPRASTGTSRGDRPLRRLIKQSASATPPATDSTTSAEATVPSYTKEDMDRIADSLFQQP